VGSVGNYRGEIMATIQWDPDGPGPEAEKVVIAGKFKFAGNVLADNIVMLDRSTGQWTLLGAGLNDVVRSLVIHPDGSLIAGGSFTASGNTPLNRIARWDGTSWSPFGGGIDWREIHSMLVLPDGNLLVSGFYTPPGATGASNVLRWDGSSWTALGTGIQGTALALARLNNGDIVAGGNFTMIGGVTTRSIARWNGTVWSPLGAGVTNGSSVNALLTFPNGDLYAGGQFTAMSNLSAWHVARWNGSAWSTLDRGTVGSVFSLARDESGNLIVGGNISSVGTANIRANGVARWNGSAWSTLGAGLPPIAERNVNSLLPLSNGELIAAGRFSAAGDVGVLNIAHWNGSAWQSLSSGFNGDVYVATHDSAGRFTVGGGFTTAGASSASGMARWNGTQWESFGRGLTPFVYDILSLPDGELIAGGELAIIGQSSTGYVARWNGTAWQKMGSGLGRPVRSLARLSNGNIIATGEYGILPSGPSNRFVARWDGTAWSSFGNFLPSARDYVGTVSHIEVDANDRVLISGSFSVPAPNASLSSAAWLNGSMWNQQNPVLYFPTYYKTLSTGESIQANRSGNASFRISLSEGPTLRDIASTSSSLLTSLELPTGDIIVGGGFERLNDLIVNGIARWDGANWHDLGSGVQAFAVVGQNNSGVVRALSLLPSGEIAVGGLFATAGGEFAPYLAVAKIPYPRFEEQPPSSASRIAGSLLTLRAGATDGLNNVSVQWLRNGVQVLDGPGGASQDGGVVSNAASLLPSPTASSFAILTISNIQPSDAGSYTAVFTNACGSVTSQPAIVTVTAAGCGPADLAGEGAAIGPDGALDNNDFVAFIQFFFDSDARADLGTQGAEPASDGAFDNNDFVVFISAFFAGC
jgi:hypothetical protein